MKSSKKKVQKIVSNNGQQSDERFAHIQQNPVFRRVPKKEKKVDIDERFQSMFHNEKFKVKSKLDKRGKPHAKETDLSFAKYYNVPEEEIKEEKETSDDQEQERQSTPEVDEKSSKQKKSQKEEKVKLSSTLKKKLRSQKIDFARGEAPLVAKESSSEDEDSESDTDDINVDDNEWGEMDKDAPRTDEITYRLALCNMDWDRLRAVDLMVIFHSFLPSGGILKSTKIYPSEYGKERLKEEEVNGPKELVEDKEEDHDADNHIDDDGDEGSSYNMEKLRKYQLNRLKYYYAVLEFDSKETADKVYNECDGMEYESSSAKIDLRFIPDEMEFDDEPTDECNEVPEINKYRPRFFTTKALQQVKVDLTWDETDPLRQELTQKVFNPEEKIDDEDLRVYLASSSDESEDEEVQTNSTSKGGDIDKYRALLESIQDEEKKKKDQDLEMEVTWGVGIKEKTEELVKKKVEETKKASLTPWEALIDKRKDKKKQKKELRKSSTAKEDDNTDSESDDHPFSDDDVDVDLDDDFFKQNVLEDEPLQSNKLKKKKNKGKIHNDEEDEGVKQENAKLELLLMDDDDNRNHFNLKTLVKDAQADSKKKKKWKNKRKEKSSVTANDNFQMDVDDSRFSALFSSHHYNIDPSDPSFKKTTGMETIITAKQKRRMETKNEEEEATSSNKSSGSTKNHEIATLVQSIKRNAAHLKASKIQNAKRFKTSKTSNKK